MVDTASYESMLHKLSANKGDGMTSWDLFWTYTRTNVKNKCTSQRLRWNLGL